MAFQAMNHGQDARATSNGACVLAERLGSAARTLVNAGLNTYEGSKKSRAQ